MLFTAVRKEESPPRRSVLPIESVAQLRGGLDVGGATQRIDVNPDDAETLSGIERLHGADDQRRVPATAECSMAATFVDKLDFLLDAFVTDKRETEEFFAAAMFAELRLHQVTSWESFDLALGVINV